MPFHIHTQLFCISKRVLRREPSVQEELSNKISSLEEDEENIFLTLRYYAQKRSQSILEKMELETRFRICITGLENLNNQLHFQKHKVLLISKEKLPNRMSTLFFKNV